MELDLTQAELPPVGTYPGVFVDCIPGTVKIKSRTYPMLKLIIEIDREKSDKSRFIVGKRYTLNTRGKRRLVADVQTWLGTQALSGDEMKKFSPEKVFLNKPCQATVTYETEDGQTVARAASYLAAGETKLTPSGKYVRSELTAPTADAVQTAPIPSGAPQPAIA